jgi:hypothetical protein
LGTAKGRVYDEFYVLLADKDFQNALTYLYMAYVNPFIRTQNGPQDLASIKGSIQDKGQAKLEVNAAEALNDAAALVKDAIRIKPCGPTTLTGPSRFEAWCRLGGSTKGECSLRYP